MSYTLVDISATLHNANIVLDAFLRNKISRHTDSNNEAFKKIFCLKKAIEYNPHDYESSEQQAIISKLSTVLEAYAYLLTAIPIVDNYQASDKTGLVSYPPIVSDHTVRTETTYSSYKIEQRLAEERLSTNEDIAAVQGEVDTVEDRVATAETNIVNQGVALGELTDRVNTNSSKLVSHEEQLDGLSGRVASLESSDVTINNNISDLADALSDHISAIPDEESIKGGYRAVATLSDLYTISSAYLKQNVTMVYVADTGKEYRLTDILNSHIADGWTEVVSSGGGGGVSGVISFNGRTGVVALNSTDVVDALGYTPFDVATDGDTFIKNQAILQADAKFSVDYGKVTKGLVFGGGVLTTEIGAGEAGFYIGNLSGVNNIPDANDPDIEDLTNYYTKTDSDARFLGINATAANSAKWNGLPVSWTQNAAMEGVVTVYNGTAYWANSDSLKLFLGLGSNAYSSTAYLPLAGGTLSGALTGTSASFTGSIAARNNLYVHRNDGLIGGSLSYDTAISQLYLYNHQANGYFSIYTADVERFKIASNGAVTIHQSLSVGGALAGTSASFTANGKVIHLQESTTASGTYLRFHNAAGAQKAYIGIFGAASNLYVDPAGADIYASLLHGHSAIFASGINNNEWNQLILGYTQYNGLYEKVKLITQRLDDAARQDFNICVNTAFSSASATLSDVRIRIGGNSGNVYIPTGFSPPSVTPSVTESGYSYFWIGNLSGISNIPS